MAKETQTKAPAKEGAESSLEQSIARMEEMVPVNLPIDSNLRKDDLVVRVDGMRYQIQRGKTVMVPRKVYDVIEQSRELDESTARMIAELEEEYNSKTSQ